VCVCIELEYVGSHPAQDIIGCDTNWKVNHCWGSVDGVLYTVKPLFEMYFRQELLFETHFTLELLFKMYSRLELRFEMYSRLELLFETHLGAAVLNVLETGAAVWSAIFTGTTVWNILDTADLLFEMHLMLQWLQSHCLKCTLHCGDAVQLNFVVEMYLTCAALLSY